MSQVMQNEHNEYNEHNEHNEEFFQKIVLNKVNQYIKINNELKSIKYDNDQLEQFLIEYLDKIDEKYIQYKQLENKITIAKTEITTRAPPTTNDIHISVDECFKRHKIHTNDEEIKRIVEDIATSIDAKRECKTRKCLKQIISDRDE